MTADSVFTFRGADAIAPGTVIRDGQPTMTLRATAATVTDAVDLALRSSAKYEAQIIGFHIDPDSWRDDNGVERFEEFQVSITLLLTLQP